MRGEKKSKRAIAVKIILSVCFFWILISFVKTDQLFEVISRVNWLYLLLSLALSPIMLVTSCLKWKMILDLNERKIPFFRLIRMYLIGYFFSNLLPSTVGGDVARSYYSGKFIKNQSFSAIAIFIERFSGILVLLILVIFSPLINVSLYRSPYIYVPSIVAIILVFITFLIWRTQKSLELLNRLAKTIFAILYKSSSFTGFTGLTSIIDALKKMYQVFYGRLEKLHYELVAAFIAIGKDRFLLFKIIGITLIFYLLTWLNVYLAFLAFGIKPDFLNTCSLVPTALFVAQFPVTLLGNIGFFESVFVLYFLLVGIPGAETLAMGLLLRFKLLTTGAVGYFVYLAYRDAKHIGEEIDHVNQSI